MHWFLVIDPEEDGLDEEELDEITGGAQPPPGDD